MYPCNLSCNACEKESLVMGCCGAVSCYSISSDQPIVSTLVMFTCRQSKLYWKGDSVFILAMRLEAFLHFSIPRMIVSVSN